ncbi:MAG: glycosyltransferase, partial [Bacteroidota bacterium]
EKIRDLVEKRHVSSVLIPCGVDTDFFKPSELSIAAQTELRLVFPNSPKRWVKNYKLFNEISEIISKKYKVPVKQVILENCSREQVREAMQTSDCIFMTSHSEASPQVIKEALACNLPVVSVNVGDVYKSVNNLPNCYVYEHHEKDNFVKAILDIYSLKRERIDLRKRVFEMGVDQHSVCKKIWNLYAN